MAKKNKKVSSVELGNRIKHLRRAKNLTQDQLAQRIGTHRSHVVKWETGASAPNHEYRTALERELGSLGTRYAKERDGEGDPMKNKLLAMASIVLDSTSKASEALMQNIQVFYESVTGKRSEDFRTEEGPDDFFGRAKGEGGT